MTIEQKIQEHLLPWKRTPLYPAPRIVCEDGFSLSVQGSEFAYCSPRNNLGPWYEVEVGFPSAYVEALMPYAEDSERPTETVYSYVPIHVVAQVIEEHGGFKRAPEEA